MDLSKHEIKITDMKAFKVGNAQNLEAATGCTVILCPEGASAGVSVVGGIANVPVFIGGLVASVIVYFITPVFTMLGLGIYLPGYLTLTAVLGGVIRFILDKAAPKFSNARGGIIAAGLLAGEGFLGVIIALGTAISIIKGM